MAGITGIKVTAAGTGSVNAETGPQIAPIPSWFRLLTHPGKIKC